MAAVPITIIGTSTGKDGTENVTIAGLASITGLEVGGGPVVPPDGPPVIWPSPGHPAHPIVVPPTIWPNPPGSGPHPEHPIVIPHPPEIQGPDLQVKVVWSAEQGWAVVLVPAGPVPTPSATPASRR